MKASECLLQLLLKRASHHTEFCTSCPCEQLENVVKRLWVTVYTHFHRFSLNVRLQLTNGNLAKKTQLQKVGNNATKLRFATHLLINSWRFYFGFSSINFLRWTCVADNAGVDTNQLVTVPCIYTA